MKRAIAWLLTFTLLISSLPLEIMAATEDAVQAAENEKITAASTEETVATTASTESETLDYPELLLDTETTAEVPADGYAYFQFTPEVTESYCFFSLTEGDDTYGYLYDDEMNQLASDDDGGESTNFSISYVLEAGVTYVLAARYYNWGSGSFPVQLQTTHSYVSEIVTEPTCTETGLQRYTCQYCGDTYEEEIEPAHSYGEDGFCTDCGVEWLETGVCGANVTWSLNRAGVLTISGTGNMYGYEGAISPFAGRSDIVSLIIEEGVTSIGCYAFDECDELTSVVIPNSVTKIEISAFCNCSALYSVTIPASVTNIELDAFDCVLVVDEANPVYSSDASGVLFNKDKTVLLSSPQTLSGSYTVPAGVTTIRENAFAHCYQLQNVVLPDSLTKIGYGTFFFCTSLTAIYIPANVTQIGTDAFYACHGLNGIWVDEANTVYSSDSVGVLFNKDKTELIQAPGGLTGAYVIPEGVETVCEGAFSACRKVTELTVPDGVKSLEGDVFSYCTNLAKVTFLGDAPATMGDSLFWETETTVYYPGDNTTWTEDVLQDYGGTVTWVAYEPPVEIVDSGTCGENVTWKLNADGLLTISGEGSMYDYEQDGSPFYGNTAITSVIIDEGVTGIGSNSFRYCQNLQSVSIPDSVLSIGDTAFHFCSNLTNIQFGSGLVSIGYSAFNSCGSLLEVVIPDGVVSLGELAFAYCYGLERVVIPETVETIGRFAFGYGQALQSITVAEQNDHYSSDDTGVLFDKDKTQLICAPKLIEGAYSIPESVITIAPSAFRGCTHLTDITIPEGVLMIEDSAFSYCTGLTSIYIPGSVTSIGTAAFSDCYNLQKFQVADSNITYCSDDTGVLFNKDKTRLLCAPGMLEGAYTIPGSVTSIDSEAFSNCQKLTDITIPEGVTAIEAWTFYNCRGLTSVTIPNSVVTIGSLAFANCRNATIIVLGNNVERIANQAFHYCSSLASIVIPASVTEIGSWAFENCSSLAEIIFEGDAPSIVLSAFNGINATAKYPATNTTWNEDTLLNYGGSLTWEAYNLSEEATASGSCGENITWTLDANGLLTISGTGAMYDYGEDPSPFYDRSDIIHVVIEDGVTTIGDSAFACCWNLESVSIANTVTTIGCTAFGDCCDLDEVTIPASVVTIRPWAFSCCDSLKKIVFEGDAPANDGSYIYENLYYSACAYYPIDNPTWTEAVMNSYGEEVSWVAYEYDADEIVFTGTSLSLNGDIGVNFYVQFAEELLADENLRMVLNVAGEAREVALADALIDVQDDGSVWYRFSCSVAAKEMADLITVQMYSTRGAIGQCKTYPAKWYYTDICGQFDREEKAELFALIEAMLNYGAASQEYFGYNTESLANAEVAAAVPETVDASSFAGAVSDTDALLDYAGASLVLESNTVLRVFFRPVTGADISSHAFTVNGETVTPVQRGNLWYIELTDIAAKELDTAYTFTAGDVTVECSALSYVNAVLNKADALDEKLVAVCKALYAYNEAANTYFSE